MSTKTTATAKATTARPIPAKSLDYFKALAQDAANWSGTPWLDGNVAAGRSGSAMSQTLSRFGVIRIEHGEGGDGQEAAYAVFTRKGVELAAQLGIDLSYLGDDVAEPIKDAQEFVSPVAATPVKATKAAATKATAKAPSASTKASAKKAPAKATTPKAPRAPGRLSQHLTAAFNRKPKGTFLSLAEIAAFASEAYPADGPRPSAGTLNKLLHMSTCPAGITPAKGGPKKVGGAVKS